MSHEKMKVDRDYVTGVLRKSSDADVHVTSAGVTSWVQQVWKFAVVP